MKLFSLTAFMRLAFFLFFWNASFGKNVLTLELEKASLPEVIRLVANQLNKNVIISSHVEGMATLHLDQISTETAFDTLLNSYGLAKWRMGDAWVVAPKEEVIKHKQDELKWQETLDQTSPLTIEFLQMTYAKVEDVVKILQGEQASLISKRGKLGVDVRTNKIFIHDNRDHIEVIKQLVSALDVPVAQIAIEARLASVDSDFERELGIQVSTKMPLMAEDDKVQNISHSERGLYSFIMKKLPDGSSLDVKLAALESTGNAEVISSPSLFTANRQTATIEAGEEVPYQQLSDNGGTAVVFKKAVVALQVTPQVLPKDKVLLALHISQDKPTNKLVLGMPTINTRQIVTHVVVKSGQTVVLGGIYETNKEQGMVGLPFVHRIPLIGCLFKQQNIRKNKRELLIFVTPRIITQDI